MTTEQNSSRTSFASQDSRLRKEDPIRQNTKAISANFQAQAKATAPSKVERRESFMIKRQSAKPVLRPSHSLAYGPDSQSFNNEWSAEHSAAHQKSIERSS